MAVYMYTKQKFNNDWHRWLSIFFFYIYNFDFDHVHIYNYHLINNEQ